mgnify:CR=1 FL=1
MNILLSAYYDRNFGDDMMVRLAARALAEHELFLNERREEFLTPFAGEDNLRLLSECGQAQIAGELRVTGSYFMMRYKQRMKHMIGRAYKEWKGKRGLQFKSIIGCSVGPFVDQTAERISMIDISAYDLITVRDRYSYEFIKKNVKSANVSYYPDIVFSTPESWLPPRSGEELLGVVVHNNVVETGNNYAFAQKLAQMCDEYIARTGKKVLLFVFDIGIEYDVLCACNVKALSKYPHMYEFMLHEDNGDTVIKNFARCKTIVSARLHGIILALRMGIPVLPVLYSDKARHMLDDLGFSGKRYTVGAFVDAPVEELYESLTHTKAFELPENLISDAGMHFTAFKRQLASL